MQAPAEECNFPKVDHYIVLQKLGDGTTARTHLAYDVKNQASVALKILKRSQNELELLQSEVQMLQRFRHQNIVKVYDVKRNAILRYPNSQRTKKITYIALELAEHGELFDFVARTGKFSEPMARRFFQ